MNQQTMYKDGTVYENGVSSDSPDVGVRAAMWISLRQKEGDSNLGRSWFHGLPTEILEQIAEALDVSLELVKTESVIRTGDYGILPVYDDIIADKVRDAAEAFAKFRESHQI